MNNKQHEFWNITKKWLAIGTAILLWMASCQFSYAGFNVNAPDAAWLGWILAISITVIELVFNEDIRKLNMTLFACGILAYVYGVYTNVIGFFFSVQGGTWESLKTNPMSVVFACILGFFIEVIPEALFVWGLGNIGEGDVLGNFFKGKKRIENWTKDVPDEIKNAHSVQIRQSRYTPQDMMK